jgi:hypothetical protein
MDSYRPSFDPVSKENELISHVTNALTSISVFASLIGRCIISVLLMSGTEDRFTHLPWGRRAEWEWFGSKCVAESYDS